MWIRIWSTACPHCGYVYERGLGYPGYSRLGFEQLICPTEKCSRSFRTNSNEWNHMSGKTKLGYLFSGIMFVYAVWVSIAIGAVLMNGPSAGDPNELQGKIRYSIVWLIFLIVVKMVRIQQSKKRSAIGDPELTLGKMKWPLAQLLLVGIPGIIALVASVVLIGTKWEEYGVDTGILGVFLLGLCVKMRWQQIPKTSA